MWAIWRCQALSMFREFSDADIANHFAKHGLCRTLRKVPSSGQSAEQPATKSATKWKFTVDEGGRISNKQRNSWGIISYKMSWNQDATNFCPGCRLKFAGCCRWRLLFAASRQLKATPYPIRASRRFSNGTSDPSTHRGCETLLRKLWKCRGRHGVKWASYHDRSVTSQTWIGCGFWSQWQFFFDPLPITHRIHVCYIIYGNIYHQYTPNVRIYTIHGSYGLVIVCYCH